MAELVNDQLATKRDLQELETRLRHDLHELEARLKADHKEVELRSTVRMGAMNAGGIAIVAVLVKLL